MTSAVKRFYKDVGVAPGEGGYVVALDGRTVRTPARNVLALPSRELAEAVADEWRAQGETIDPETMPLTKTANTVIDRVAANREQIAADLAQFAMHDLLSYREEAQSALTRRQAAAWDPLLDWAAERYGARLNVGGGVASIEQPEAAVAALARAIAAVDPHRLAALHAAITITGSAVLGLALLERVLDAERAFATSRIDETYQAELWGRDAEDEARAERLKAELAAAERYLSLLP